MRRVASGIATAALLSIAACGSTSESLEVIVGSSSTITAELASSDEQRRSGLSQRPEVRPGTGMLFLFDDEQIPRLWMAETLVSLDALWVYRGRVVEISHMTPCLEDQLDDCPIWTPAEDVDAVLETPPGHDAEVGDPVRW